MWRLAYELHSRLSPVQNCWQHSESESWRRYGQAHNSRRAPLLTLAPPCNSWYQHWSQLHQLLPLPLPQHQRQPQMCHSGSHRCRQVFQVGRAASQACYLALVASSLRWAATPATLTATSSLVAMVEVLWGQAIPCLAAWVALAALVVSASRHALTPSDRM